MIWKGPSWVWGWLSRMQTIGKKTCFEYSGTVILGIVEKGASFFHFCRTHISIIPSYQDMMHMLPHLSRSCAPLISLFKWNLYFFFSTHLYLQVYTLCTQLRPKRYITVLDRHTWHFATAHIRWVYRLPRGGIILGFHPSSAGEWRTAVRPEKTSAARAGMWDVVLKGSGRRVRRV